MTSKIVQSITEARGLVKAPPGPKPKRFGSDVGWDEQRRRWVKNPQSQGDASQKPSEAQPRRSMATGEYRVSEWLTEQQFSEDLLNDIGYNVDQEFDAQQAPSYAHAGEHRALTRYTNEDFQWVNQALRGEKMPFTDRQDTQDIIDDMTELLKPIQEPQVVYRGTGDYVLAQLASSPERELKVDSFMSTSRHPKVAMDFTPWGFGVFMEIETTPTTQAITLHNEDTHHNEHETILGFGQRLKVDSREWVPVVDPDGEIVTHYTYLKCRVVEEGDA